MLPLGDKTECVRSTGRNQRHTRRASTSSADKLISRSALMIFAFVAERPLIEALISLVSRPAHRASS